MQRYILAFGLVFASGCPAGPAVTDISSDVSTDAVVETDSAGLDVALDTTPDALADTASDTAPPDVSADVTPDTSVDAMPDASLDVTPDDSGVDTVPDTPDSGSDASETTDDAEPDTFNVGNIATSCGSPTQDLTPVDCTQHGDTNSYCVFSNHCACGEAYVCSTLPLAGNECQPGSTCVPKPVIPDFPPQVFPPFVTPDVSNVDDFADAYVDAVCHAIVNCRFWNDNHTQGQLTTAPTLAYCKDTIGLNSWADAKDLAAAATAGTIAYDAAAAGTCLAAVATTCQWVVNPGKRPGTNCGEAFAGTVALGGTCLRSEECTGDAYCDHGADQATCPGTCVPTSALGDACSIDAECPQGGSLTRGYCAGTYVCVQQSAGLELAAVGQPCGKLNVGDQLTQVVSCAPEYACESVLGVDVCVPPYPAGEACSDNDTACVAGYVCDNLIAGEPKTCLEAVTSTTAGAPCGDNIKEPPYCDVQLDLGCDIQLNQCVAGGDGTLGASCSPFANSYNVQHCHGGLVCDKGTFTCVAPLPAGSACAFDAVCASGQCDMTTGTCRERRCQ